MEEKRIVSLWCWKDGFPVSSASGPGVEKLARCQKAAGESEMLGEKGLGTLSVLSEVTRNEFQVFF